MVSTTCRCPESTRSLTMLGLKLGSGNTGCFLPGTYVSPFGPRSVTVAKSVPLLSRAYSPENPPSLRPPPTSGASSARASTMIVGELIDGPGGAAAAAVAGAGAGALLAGARGAATAVAGAGAGSSSGCAARAASSRADSRIARSSAWSKLVDGAGPLTMLPSTWRLKRNMYTCAALTTPGDGVLRLRPAASSPSGGTGRSVQPAAVSDCRVAARRSALSRPEWVRATENLISVGPLVESSSGAGRA